MKKPTTVLSSFLCLLSSFFFPLSSSGCVTPTDPALLAELKKLRQEVAELKAGKAEPPAKGESPMANRPVEVKPVVPPLPPQQMVAPPLPTIPTASIIAPLAGCERGPFTLAIENGTRFYANIWLDGVPLKAVGGIGPVDLVLVDPGGTIFTCLSRLGEHKIEAEFYTLVAGVPQKVACYKALNKFKAYLGYRDRQEWRLEEVWRMREC